MSVEISATLVKDLRERTGVGFMECKKALAESNGDLDGAVKILRERGVAKAEKRAGRATAEGLIGFKADGDKKATLVELNCETDFVARNDQFQGFLAKMVEFVHGLASMPAAAKNGEVKGEALLDLPHPAFPGHTVREAMVEQMAKTGENMLLRRAARFETKDGFITGYIHPPGKIGVLVEFSVEGGVAGLDAAALASLGKDIAMQVAASRPAYVERTQVDAKHLEAEKDIYANKARLEGKPEAILPKIVEGMVQKFYKDVCLIDQPFVKDPNLAVSKVIEQTSKTVGRKITAVRFVRLQVGEADDSQGSA